MLKNTLITLCAICLMTGCASSSATPSKYSVTEPTDYAMDCNSLLNEIKVINTKLNNKDNLLESFVPDSLMDKEHLTDNDKLVLSERKKSLQLIYTLKEAKHECRTLTVNDTRQDKKITRIIKEVKDTTAEVQEELK